MKRGLRLSVTGIVVAVACGGQIYGNPLGNLDDAGVFHAPDGSVVFGPGSACVGYDNSAFDQLWSSEPCSDDQECVDWFNARAPSNYTWGEKCSQGIETSAKTCTAHFIVEHPTINTGAGVYCTPGPTGDAYCASMFGQFLLGDARVSSACIHLCKMQFPEHGDAYCESGTDEYKCETGQNGSQTPCDSLANATLGLWVYRGDSGVAHCEAPCTPPPEIGAPSDAGDDQ